MSTLMALLSLKEEICRSMDNKNFTVGIFIDLAKAFHTANHRILLEKLKHYGLRDTTNDCFKSYLENRKQFVVINKTSSNRSTITCGVLQGSILGPLLFILYINDLNTVCRRHQSTPNGQKPGRNQNTIKRKTENNFIVVSN